MRYGEGWIEGLELLGLVELTSRSAVNIATRRRGTGWVKELYWSMAGSLLKRVGRVRYRKRCSQLSYFGLCFRGRELEEVLRRLAEKHNELTLALQRITIECKSFHYSGFSFEDLGGLLQNVERMH